MALTRAKVELGAGRPAEARAILVEELSSSSPSIITRDKARCRHFLLSPVASGAARGIARASRRRGRTQEPAPSPPARARPPRFPEQEALLSAARTLVLGVISKAQRDPRAAAKWLVRPGRSRFARARTL